MIQPAGAKLELTVNNTGTTMLKPEHFIPQTLNEADSSLAAKYNDMVTQIENAEKTIRKLEEPLKQVASQLRKSVELSYKGKTPILTFNGKTWKCLQGRGNSFNVVLPSGRVIKEYRGSLNDIRLSIALGEGVR